MANPKNNMATAKAKKNTTVVKEKAPKKVATDFSASSKVYDMKGKESGSIDLPQDVFGQKWNSDLVHQVVTSMLSSARTNVAHTKNRGEVRGGGKKPWQQKGTGRARHGSRRSPLWVGGGITFGPRNEKDYTRKVNKKMRSKALYTILSEKMKKGEVLFVSDLSFKAPKTKEAREVLASLSKLQGFSGLLNKRNNSALVALSSKDINTEKSFSNFGNLLVDEIRNINPVQLMKYKYLVISNPEKGLPQIGGKLD